MRILLCHNYYLQPGGEDQVFADEGRLLESRGHEVLRYTADNRAVASMSRVKLAWRTIWNSHSYREVRKLVRQSRPDVMHCTNTFPLLSPSIYYAAQAEGVPVVQSLHNFRMVCANGVLRTSEGGGRPCPVGGFFRCAARLLSPRFPCDPRRAGDAAIPPLARDVYPHRRPLCRVDRFLPLDVH